MRVPTPATKRSHLFYDVSRNSKDEMDTLDPTLMHNACKYFSNNALIIDMVLQSNQNAVRNPYISKKHCNAHQPAKRSRLADREEILDGGYPFYIALSYNASFDVVKLLINKDPGILVLKDAFGCTPLHIALKNQFSFDIICQIISINGATTKMADNRQNLPLHTACVTGCTSDVMMLLVHNNPAGLESVDFNGKTPFELAVCSEKFGDAVIDYLQDVMYKEDDVEELDL